MWNSRLRRFFRTYLSRGSEEALIGGEKLQSLLLLVELIVIMTQNRTNYNRRCLRCPISRLLFQLRGRVDLMDNLAKFAILRGELPGETVDAGEAADGE